MNALRVLSALLVIALHSPPLLAQAAVSGVADSTPFAELLMATRFIENYKETAAVSARVFAAATRACLESSKVAKGAGIKF